MMYGTVSATNETVLIMYGSYCIFHLMLVVAHSCEGDHTRSAAGMQQLGAAVLGATVTPQAATPEQPERPPGVLDGCPLDA
eukprot:20918-Pleurochrysis_carterae.AAC.1